MVEYSQSPVEVWLYCSHQNTKDVSLRLYFARVAFNHPKKISVKSMIDQFVQLYSPDAPKWENISSLASSFEWTDMLAQTTSEYLDTHGISPKFTRELVEAATRVNYGQDADEIHALEGACSMAATGASSIKGGNFKIFEQFILRSKANLFLSDTVRPYLVYYYYCH